ncbi:MAG TPA: abortive infection family protein [Puia sp.]|nr:abortive infection family protein [Puia sp.]
MQKNNITTITRRSIADNLTVSNLWYHGRLDEPDFLTRIFNLQEFSSTDGRYQDAAGDIRKHTVMNNDWEPDWVFTDARFNLMHCPDEKYLQFLCETIHPAVRSSESEVDKMLALYNKQLTRDGFEIVSADEISGRPIFKGSQRLDGAATLQAKKTEIKKYLNTAYINSKLTLMNEAVHKDTDLAIGTAKELLETVCKSILQQQGVTADKDWQLARLLKETTAALDFEPKKAAQAEKAATSVRQILAGLGTAIQGVAEMRNAYGSGHGKTADFQGLEPKYAKFIVGIIAEIAILLLATNGETAELVEASTIVEDLPF